MKNLIAWSGAAALWLGSCLAQAKGPVNFDGGSGSRSISVKETVQEMKRPDSESEVRSVPGKPVQQADAAGDADKNEDEGAWERDRVEEIIEEGSKAVEKLTPLERKVLAKRVVSELRRMKSGQALREARKQMEAEFDLMVKNGAMSRSEADAKLKEALKASPAILEDMISELEKVLKLLKAAH